MWQHVNLSEQNHPLDTLVCCWDVKQPTNIFSVVVVVFAVVLVVDDDDEAAAAASAISTTLMILMT